MFGSGIIDWIYQLVLAIVSYFASWFGFGTMNSNMSEDVMVDVKPPMPNLLPEMAAFPSSDLVDNMP